MNKYFALHTTKGNPEEGWQYFRGAAPELAAAMFNGQTPARCLKTWDPFTFGRGDYVFCLWEAEKPEDIDATLRLTRLLDYVTIDLMPVQEVDWAELAQSAAARAPALTGA